MSDTLATIESVLCLIVFSFTNFTFTRSYNCSLLKKISNKSIVLINNLLCNVLTLIGCAVSIMYITENATYEQSNYYTDNNLMGICFFSCLMFHSVISEHTVDISLLKRQLKIGNLAFYLSMVIIYGLSVFICFNLDSRWSLYTQKYFTIISYGAFCIPCVVKFKEMWTRFPTRDAIKREFVYGGYFIFVTILVFRNFIRYFVLTFLNDTEMAIISCTFYQLASVAISMINHIYLFDSQVEANYEEIPLQTLSVE